MAFHVEPTTLSNGQLEAHEMPPLAPGESLANFAVRIWPDMTWPAVIVLMPQRDFEELYAATAGRHLPALRCPVGVKLGGPAPPQQLPGAFGSYGDLLGIVALSGVGMLAVIGLHDLLVWLL
jgi:hypothetical protein